MKHQIRNQSLVVEISALGAELSSIRKVGEDLEYLWQLNPKIWERQAPLLFPIVGRLKDEEYTYGGRTYRIQIHGFAREKVFQVVQHSDDRVEFILLHDSDTLACYPFKFRLRIIYSLHGNEIRKTHVVENLGDGPMYYEIGGHEGYNLALFEGERMEDYFIEFHGMKELHTYTTDADIMVNRKKKNVPFDEASRLYLSYEVFRDDALIIDGFSRHMVCLRNTKNNRSVTVKFDDFQYLGLWTKYMRSNYICIEPWSSLPDCNYLGKELSEKEGVRKLEAFGKETLAYSIIIE
ncbi:MAG: aldose 1-epimerase family protein [Clostridia bacterium]